MGIAKLNRENLGDIKRRVIFFALFLFSLFLIVIVRLWYLQIIKGETFNNLSENNRIRVISMKSPRGKILDRNGELLADTRPSFNLQILPENVTNMDQTLDALLEIVALDKAEAKKRIKQSPSFRDVIIKRDITRAEVAYIEEHKLDLNGVSVEVEPRRNYLFGSLAAHILGYMGEINENQIKLVRGEGYKPGDFVGQYGLEREFEKFLRGKLGRQELEVDAYGRELRVVDEIEPIQGYNLILTIDKKLQSLAEDLIGHENGAIVAMNPQTGQILALVSHPSFNPNPFAVGITNEEWSLLIKNESHPLNNRSLQGLYPPGSVFKIAVAMAALEEGVINPQTTFHCPGYFVFGGRSFSCWKKGGHGSVNLYSALVNSCDVFFYNVGVKLGVDNIAKYAQGFGLGKKTGLNLTNEKPGVIPSSTWKKETKGEPWYPGETVSSAIGQGYNLVTPLQIAVMVSAVANGGKVYVPFVVQRIENLFGETIKTFQPKVESRAPAHPENLELVRKALKGVVNDPGGTGWRAKIEGFTVSGKTGTAQVVSLNDSDGKRGPQKYKDHAWFVAFAPFEKPELVVVTLVENAGRGGATLAPWAKEIIKAHFNLP